MKLLFASRWLLLLFPMVLPSVTEATEDTRPVVVASTTMIRALLEDIGGDGFDILTLVPPTSCPGHFDLKPGDVHKIRKADLIVCHPYQKDLQKVLKQYIQDERRWCILREEHSLAVPEYYVEAGWELMKALSLHFPEQSASLKNRWNRQQAKLMNLEKECKLSFRKGLAQKSPVIVAYRQKDFIESRGLKVAGVFDTPEGDTMQQVISLVREGRKQGVRAVIGNLQNGDRQAKVLSEKLGVPFIMLSNFPGSKGSDVSYEALLQANCSKLLKILR